MVFQVGDKVIHWNYGLGDVTQIEEKVIQDRQSHCYVVRTHDLLIWVPVDEQGQCSLRQPTPREEFEALFVILGSPGQTLPDDRLERKNLLHEQLKDGRLSTICRVIRDLSVHGTHKKLNDQDKFILERAKSLLLAEWVYSLGVPLPEAQQRMLALLSA